MSMSGLEEAATFYSTATQDQIQAKLRLDHLSLHDNSVRFYDDDEYIRELLIQERKAFVKEFNALDQQTDKALWTVVRPRSDHICTVIILHERNEFPQSLARRLFDSPIGYALWALIPGIKWVFPKAPASLNRFGKQPMWFADRDSPDHRQDIEQNTDYLDFIIDHEAKAFHGDTNKILLGGVQQGAAMAMHTLLQRCTSVRGLISVGGWLEPELVPHNTCSRMHITRPMQYTPIFALHDRIDEVVSTDYFHQMLAVLHARGLEVGHIETEANQLRKVQNRPLFEANRWETQIIKALSGLQRLPDRRNHLKGLGLPGMAMPLRHTPKEAISGGLADMSIAPFGRLPDPGAIGYSLGRVPSHVDTVGTTGWMEHLHLEDVATAAPSWTLDWLPSQAPATDLLSNEFPADLMSASYDHDDMQETLGTMEPNFFATNRK